MNAVLFFKKQVEMRKLTLQSLLVKTWSTNKFHQTNQLNRAGNILVTIRADLPDSQEIINPVKDRRTERTKNIPCPSAHPRIGHRGEYPLPHRGGRKGGISFREKACSVERGSNRNPFLFLRVSRVLPAPANHLIPFPFPNASRATY